MLSGLDIDPECIAGWQPFFIMAGGAAAALAGLLFIALSIHVREIAAHPAFRYRALATLSIPLVVLVVSGLALLPRQTGRPSDWPSWCRWCCSSAVWWHGSGTPARA
jgi:hypothetical protein